MAKYSLAFVLTVILCGLPVSAQTLPGTAPLDWPEADLSVRMMDGAHAFVERKIAEAAGVSNADWGLDESSPAALQQSVVPKRQRLREILGVVDERLAPRMERFGTDEQPALVAETGKFKVWQVRWRVLEGVSSEGLLVEPAADTGAQVVWLPDADQTPEQALGLAPGIPPSEQIARILAESGARIVIPALINRERFDNGDEQVRKSDQSNREWIYRQAFQMGRHIIGYEVQKALAAVDWFSQHATKSGYIAVAGYGEGGMLALYTGALDTRIDVTFVSGYHGPTDRNWSEPIYRNVFDLAQYSGRRLEAFFSGRATVRAYTIPPVVPDQKGVIPQAPVEGPPFAPVEERGMISILHAQLRLPKPGTQTPPPLVDTRRGFSPEERHDRLRDQLEAHVQGLVRKSEQVRDEAFLFKVMPEFNQGRWSTKRRHDTFDPGKFTEGAKAYRKEFDEELIGKFDEDFVAANPRTRKVAETDSWTAYDVVLDVYPELFAWGVLVLPKDLKPGERRPVVVCQHGRNGLPRDTIDAGNSAYNDFAGKLAEQGFITFAPHNLYRGEDRYRWLDRKANAVGCTLFSFIVAQHRQILSWLKTRPEVDGDRIAFYGLSYGGETAVRVPSIIEDYCLSICSGDFNQWTRKVAATDQPFSFMRSIEWEMPYWNLGNTFDYAEMTYLIFPRPFMVERGHWDMVGRDPWVAHEYAKVAWLYAQFGMADRTEIEYFQGGHSINGEGTFEFLHKHLNWPTR